MSKFFKVLPIVCILVVVIFAVQFVWISFIKVDEDDVNGYAAAFASIDQNKGKSEEEIRKIAENYLKKKAFVGSNELFCNILDQIYSADEIPVVYTSIPELKSGIEESLMILADYTHLMDEKNTPTMEGYTSEDFYRLLDERVIAEENILKELNSDTSPDLYQYALKLYQAREAHPVIY